MRLRRLDLTRYGKFTDHMIDFGPRAEGVADLHVIYGPNEAGKSTTTAAFLDLLFGIETRSRYGFLHPYATMQIGATLELAGGPRQLVRIKRPQKSLLGPDDQPVPDSLIHAELGVLDRAAYRAMFSLDDDTLEEGGESILASQGDIGQLLFSATTGLAELSRTLLQLKLTADGFYKFHGRGGALSDLKAELAKLKEERDRIDTLASEYARLGTARDTATRIYETAIREQGQLQFQIDAIQRSLTVLPLMSSLHDTRRQLAPLLDLPDAPVAWLTELPDLEREEITLATKLEGLDAEIDRTLALARGIVVDQVAADMAGQLHDLATLRARNRTAEADIPVRRRELAVAVPAIAAILARLEKPGETDPARLILKPRQLAALREGIKARPDIEAAIRAATTERINATRKRDAAQADLDQASGPVDDGSGRQAGMSHLASAIGLARLSDHAMRQRAADRALPAAREDLARRLEALLPWSGDAAALARLAVAPTDRIDGWKGTAERHDADQVRLASEMEGLVARETRLQAEIDAIGRVAGLVDDHAAAQIRGLREAAWAEHRRVLDLESAAQFDQALRHDDFVMSARLGHQSDVAKLHEKSAAVAVLQADIGRVRSLIETAHQANSATQAELAIAADAIGLHLPQPITPSALKAWSERRTEALKSNEALRAAERAKAEADADAAAAHAALLASMKRAGVVIDADATWDDLVATAQIALDREVELKSLRKALADHNRDVAARQIALQDAQAAEQVWAQAWRDTCAACWLGERDPVPNAAEVSEILLLLGDMGPLLESVGTLARRISDMEADQLDFSREVARVSQELGIATGATPAATLSDEIDRRIQAAQQAAAELEKLTAQLQAAHLRRDALVENSRINQRRKAAMTSVFAVTTLREVEASLQLVQKRDALSAQSARLEQDILAAMNAAAITDAEAAIAGTDRDALEAELATLRARLDGQVQTTREHYANQQSATAAIERVGGDDAAARIDERRRTVLLDIEDRALGYLRLRAGIVAAEMALRVYRDKHRSSMMSRASDAFRLISRGAYSGLSTRPEKDGDVLIAIGAGTGAKLASDLSKGTRFQLYLALRAAGYHEFATSRPSVPFIADDIMETFDDFRAEEAFRLFGEMAQVGQVIYLTHHRHLCEIARQVVPGVRIHALPTA